MRELIQNWPVRSVVLMKELCGFDVCPTCAAPLDTGKVCVGCSQDWHRYVPARYKWTPPSSNGQ